MMNRLQMNQFPNGGYCSVFGPLFSLLIICFPSTLRNKIQVTLKLVFEFTTFKMTFRDCIVVREIDFPALMRTLFG
jgi:hypothetical protein